MPAPLLPLGVLGLLSSIAGVGFMTKGFTSEYEENFDYDYYERDHPRFYSPIWASEDNPSGFNEEMYNEARQEYYRIRPIY